MSRPYQSLPVRGAWIEMRHFSRFPAPAVLSLPVRGAWIEMRRMLSFWTARNVAPRAGSVD